MKFGNWYVKEESIEWGGKTRGRFEIPLSSLNAVRPGFGDDVEYYDWILVATDEEWLTQNDLYDLNYAFVYAIAKTGSSFNYDIFDATLDKQFERFDEEDDEEE
jgi:hypothetical protein